MSRSDGPGLCHPGRNVVGDLVVLLAISPCRWVCTGQMDPHLQAAKPPAGLLAPPGVRQQNSRPQDVSVASATGCCGGAQRKDRIKQKFIPRLRLTPRKVSCREGTGQGEAGSCLRPHLGARGMGYPSWSRYRRPLVNLLVIR